MSYKKIASALMAFAMAASMTAVAVNAEEDAADTAADNAPVAEETQAPDPEPEPTQAPDTTPVAPETEPETTTRVKVVEESGYVTETQEENTENTENTETQPVSESEAVDTETALNSETTTTSAIMGTTTETDGSTLNSETTTTGVTTATTAAATTEKVSEKLSAPSLGEFKISSTEGADGTNAVISWGAVAGADGYQVYKTSVDASDPDLPTSYAFEVKGTSYQTAGSVAYKETIKVRAFQIVNGEKVYGPWSSSKTVYMNGMKQETTATKAASKKETTTTKTKTAAAAAKKDSGKTESPKTGDSADIPAVTSAASAALVAGLAAMKKKKD